MLPEPQDNTQSFVITKLFIIFLCQIGFLRQYFITLTKTQLSKYGKKMKIIKKLQKRKNLPKQSFKVLPNNRIEKEFKEIVRSFNLPLRILLSSKYDVHNNHIYPNQSKCQLVLSFCRMLFFNSMCLFRMYSTLSSSMFVNSATTEDVVFYFVLILFTIAHSFSFTMLFIIDIVHKYNNVSLILKIQTVHKSIDFSKSLPTYVIWNWISILITISADIFITAGFYSKLHGLNIVIYLLNMLNDSLFFAFDINLMIATRVIVLLRKYLEEWIVDVLRTNNEQDNDEHCHQLLETYQNILEAYNLYKTIYQVLVSV